MLRLILESAKVRIIIEKTKKRKVGISAHLLTHTMVNTFKKTVFLQLLYLNVKPLFCLLNNQLAQYWTLQIVG